MELTNKPIFESGDLRAWAVGVALPWLVERLHLSAGVICGSLSTKLRRQVYGLQDREPLVSPIDWGRNGIIISPPGTGKGMVIFVEALAHFKNVYVLVPSVVQAHKQEASLNLLYHDGVAGAQTSQRKTEGLIHVITTGVFHFMVRNRASSLWDPSTVLFVDEAQRILEDDPKTEFMVGYCAERGVRTMIVSATISVGNLAIVFGRSNNEPALVYELTKQMHPIEIGVYHNNDLLGVLQDMPQLQQPNTTTLVFASSRRQIMGIVKSLSEDFTNVTAVPITGAHQIEVQLEYIEHAQKSRNPVVVVATPGTMDSSVTISGLSTVVIIDERIVVNWNQHGVTERHSEPLPINHIWQMVRRVGREVRAVGDLDRVYILSSMDRDDVVASDQVFTPIVGSSPSSPIEGLLLNAVALCVPFNHVHDYMVSNFSDSRIQSATARLIHDNIITLSTHPLPISSLTPLGQLTVALPYEYVWSSLIALAPRDLQLYLCVIASFGRLSDLDMFENTNAEEVVRDPDSELFTKLSLGIDYLNARHNNTQIYMTDAMDLSVRRMDQMEQLFSMGCDALGVSHVPIMTMPIGVMRYRLLKEIVQKGIATGLYQLFFASQNKYGEWTDVRRTPDMQNGYRKFIINTKGLDMMRGKNIYTITTVPVIGTTQWFTTRAGAASAHVDDVTIVPALLADIIVEQYAQTRQDWFVLVFTRQANGKFHMISRKGKITYVASNETREPIAGKRYYCSVDMLTPNGTTSVFVYTQVPAATNSDNPTKKRIKTQHAPKKHYKKYKA